MWVYAGQLTIVLPWYSNSWVVEIPDGPQPTLAQICLSVVGIPVDEGYAAGYIVQYVHQDVGAPEPVSVQLHDTDLPNWTFVTMVMNPTMTSVTFTVAGSSDLAANVNVAVLPGWGVPVYPPYGIPPP
jgi:hypothetical protein